MKSVEEADLKNKKVLMRAGFDVAVDERGNIIDDTRIKEALPTIKYILEREPKELVIISHLGRPEGKIVKSLRLDKVAVRLTQLLGIKNYESRIKKTAEGIPSYVMQEEIPGQARNDTHISLLENIRFYPEEEKNDPEFAKKLASLGEVFIFEAFSAAHREQASTIGIMDYLPSYAGLEMEKESRNLSKLLGEVEHPYVVVIGGAKTEDKAPVILSLKNKADKILVGGRTSNLLHQQGKYQNDNKVVLNIDGINESKQVIKPDQDPMAALDIGPETIKLFRSEIVKAHTILVAGPLGKIEEAAYANGTREIFFAVGYSNAYKVAAGGDTIEALKKFGLFENFNFVSGGGGAALEFLAKGTLPAIQKLENQK